MPAKKASKKSKASGTGGKTKASAKRSSSSRTGGKRSAGKKGGAKKSTSKARKGASKKATSKKSVKRAARKRTTKKRARSSTVSTKAKEVIGTVLTAAAGGAIKGAVVAAIPPVKEAAGVTEETEESKRTEE